jgi:hypothetical protein
MHSTNPEVRDGGRCRLTMFPKQVSGPGRQFGSPIVAAEAEQGDRTTKKDLVTRPIGGFCALQAIGFVYPTVADNQARPMPPANVDVDCLILDDFDVTRPRPQDVNNEPNPSAAVSELGLRRTAKQMAAVRALHVDSRRRASVGEGLRAHAPAHRARRTAWRLIRPEFRFRSLAHGSSRRYSMGRKQATCIAGPRRPAQPRRALRRAPQ